MVGPGSGRTVMARAYLAPAPVNDNIRNMSTCDIFKITCDLHHVCAERPSGELASFDNRQNLRPFQRTSTVSKSALAISEEQHDLADAVFGQLDRLNSRAAARANLEKGATHPSEIWSAGKDLGWNGLAIAEEHGGSGFGLAELAGVLEAPGRELSPRPFLPTLAAPLVVAPLPPGFLRAQLLPGLAAGRTVGPFQAVKHHAANMLVNAEETTAATWDAARADDLDSAWFAAAVAASHAIRTQVLNAQNNIQLHGGIGYTWEHDAHLYLRRARTLAALMEEGGGPLLDVGEGPRAGQAHGPPLHLAPEA